MSGTLSVMARVSTNIGLVVLVAVCLTGCVVAPDVATPSVTPAPPVSVDELIIDGIYEVTTTEDDLHAAGVTDATVIAETAGTYYWTFDDGTWTYEQVSDQPLETPNALGTYTIDGDTYTHHWSEGGDDVTTATIEVLPDGSLQFTNIVDADPAFQQISEVTFGLHPWARIGDL